MNEFLEEFLTTNYFLSSNENTVTTTNKTFQEYCAVFYNIHPDINFFFFWNLSETVLPITFERNIANSTALVNKK